MRDGVVFSVRSDGHVLGAPGLAGGGPGGTARLVRNAGTEREEELSSKTASIVLAAGETVQDRDRRRRRVRRPGRARSRGAGGGSAWRQGLRRWHGDYFAGGKMRKSLTHFTDFAFAALVV